MFVQQNNFCLCLLTNFASLSIVVMLLFKYGDVLTVTYSKTLILTRMYSIFMQGDRSNKNVSHKKVKFFFNIFRDSAVGRMDSVENFVDFFLNQIASYQLPGTWLCLVTSLWTNMMR
jgi:hypothetical protein